MKAPDFKNPRRFQMTTNEVTHDVTAEEQEVEKIRRKPRKEFGVEQLKAERVQLVAKRLRSMPGWRLINDSTALHRVHHFPEPRVALAYAAYVGELSTALKVGASVLISGARAVVTVRGVRRGGFRDLTDAILEFAAALG
jgi:pterin-4a-carbinolamine dehydratase